MNICFRNRAAHALAACVLTSAAAGVASADSVISSGTTTGDVNYWGETDTASYGQTFTVGADTYLNSFTFDLKHVSGDVTDYDFFVMAWDGDSATGGVLFTSGAFALTSNTMTPYTFDTGSLQLSTGQTYVAFVNTSGRFDGDGNAASMGHVGGNTYGGGEFVFLNNGSNFSSVTSLNWTKNWTGLGGDTTFTASFSSSASAVPLPAAAWAGMALFGVLGGAKLRRRKVDAV